MCECIYRRHSNTRGSPREGGVRDRESGSGIRQGESRLECIESIGTESRVPVTEILATASFPRLSIPPACVQRIRKPLYNVSPTGLLTFFHLPCGGKRFRTERETLRR